MQWFLKHKLIVAVLIFVLIYGGFRLTVSPERRYDNYIQKAHQTLFFPVKVKNLEKAVQASPHLGGLWNAGIWLYNNADYDAAESCFQQLVNLYGQIRSRRVAEAYFLLGRLAGRQGLESERDYYEKALAADPTLGFLYDELAGFYAWEDTAELYRKGIANDPAEGINYWGLCEHFVEMDLGEISLEELATVIPLEKATGRALAVLASEINYELIDAPVACELVQLALARDDANPFSYQLLAEIYLNREQYAEAETMLQQALRLERNQETTLDLAYLYMMKGDSSAVINTFLNALCYDDLTLGGKKLLAQAYERTGNIVQAYRWYAECASVEPGVTQYRTRLQQNPEVQAMLEAETANGVTENPDRQITQYIARKRSQVDEAFESYGVKGAGGMLEEAFQQIGDLSLEIVAEMHFYLGKMRLMDEKLESAMQSFQRAIEIDPTHGGAYAGLAKCYTGEKQVQTYIEGIHHAPWAPENYISLIKYYGELGLQIPTLTQSHLRELIPLELATSQALVKLGEFFATSANGELARTMYEQALIRSDSCLDAHRALGQMDLEQQRYAEAQSHFAALVHDAFPIPIFSNDRFEEYYNLARTYYELHQYDETIAILLGCVEDEELYPGKGVVLLAKAYFAKGDRESATFWADKLPATNTGGMELRSLLKQK